MSIELIKRIFTSVFLIVIVLFCLFISNYSWFLLIFFVSLICLYEFIKLSLKIWKNKFTILLFSLFGFSYLCVFTFVTFKIRTFLDLENILLIFLICICSDIGGYVTGKTIGGKKLTKISPNKTLSGSLGSFLFSIIIPIIFYRFSEFESISAFILWCLIVSLTCQIGDLIISYFKRLAKVKDVGNILPGHGGMLDRIDGIIFGVPSAVIFLQFYFQYSLI